MESVETKAEATKLFKKLFSKKSRTNKNWKDMLDSLATGKYISEKKAFKWYYNMVRPTIDAPSGLKGKTNLERLSSKLPTIRLQRS